MFESPDKFDSAMERGGADQRRTFAWAELSARLAAVRDARAVLDRACAAQGGSFVRAGAVVLERSGQGEGAVNPNGLGDGKANGSGLASAALEAQIVDREAE